MTQLVAGLRRIGRALRSLYRLVHDGQEDLDTVYPDHEPKPSLEQAATAGLGGRRWFRRS